MRKIIEYLMLIYLIFSVVLIAQDMEKENLIYIVFDPTILSLGDAAEFNLILEKLKVFYFKIPDKSRLKVLFIEKEMINRDFIFDDHFKYDKTTHYLKNMEKLKREKFEELSVSIKDKWEFYHTEEAYKKATSCILSSLYRVSKDINGQTSKYKTFVLYISDMLEFCDEWDDITVYSNDYTSKLCEVALSDEIIDLSSVDKFIIVKVPDNRFSKLKESVQFERCWTKIISSCGIVPQAIEYKLNKFPENLFKD